MQPVAVVWINRVASEIVYSLYIPKSHPGFSQGKRHSWNGDTVETSCRVGLNYLLEVITATKKLMNTVQPVVASWISRVAGEIVLSGRALRDE